MALCLDKKSYAGILRTEKCKDKTHWLDNGEAATTHFLEGGGGRFVVVCLGTRGTLLDAIELLAHEACHVVQDFVRYAGIENHDDEVEAYMFGVVTSNLAQEYLRLTSYYPD
jgi:3-keto-L-gulonate-6-phosphate decarboxylase